MRPTFPAQNLVGRWGLTAYHNEADRERTITAAANQCRNPYVITMGPTGGVMMHLADQSTPTELALKGAPGNKNYIGPKDEPPASAQDREVVSFDGRVLILRWMDPEVQSRYGTMVYVRCGAEGQRPKPKAKPRARPAAAAAPKPVQPPIQRQPTLAFQERQVEGRQAGERPERTECRIAGCGALRRYAAGRQGEDGVGILLENLRHVIGVAPRVAQRRLIGHGRDGAAFGKKILQRLADLAFAGQFPEIECHIGGHERALGVPSRPIMIR